MSAEIIDFTEMRSALTDKGLGDLCNRTQYMAPVNERQRACQEIRSIIKAYSTSTVLRGIPQNKRLAFVKAIQALQKYITQPDWELADLL
jgi:hypothetical protein